MTGELTSEFVETGLTEDGQLVMEPGYINYLRSQGYLIDSVQEIHTADSSRDDMAHLVVKIGTFEYPKDHPALDYAEHSVSLWVCDCEDFRYRQSVDLSEASPGECGACKHIKEVDKVQRALNDEDQSTL